ncbi:hypothetical protein [Shinella sp. HZN7]|uniref:hypothetical protein n=1 Tax=Shinella sp. (strain HZN7) TaxID=879274 RepID=UPI0011AB3CD7|nr:hypothetical protein [Shinella sp. HZN7]
MAGWREGMDTDDVDVIAKTNAPPRITGEDTLSRVDGPNKRSRQPPRRRVNQTSAMMRER